jgi:hypothetical protein
MKKNYQTLIALFAMAAPAVSAQNIEVGAYKFQVNNDAVENGQGVTLVGFTDQSNQQTAEEEYSTLFFETGRFTVNDNNYVLTEIADNAFSWSWKHKFNDITIPSTVKRVGSNAFAGAFNEDGVNESDHTTYKATLTIRGGTIGGGAFQNVKFKNVIIDGTETPVTLVNENWQSSFANAKFSYLSIDGDVAMAENQFQNCGVAHVYVNCKDIPARSFSNCGFRTGSKQWSFGEDIEHIGERAFENLVNGIGELVLGCKNVTIDQYAFDNAGITSVECANTFSGTIGAYAFNNNRNLEKVSIYSESIGHHTFNNCVNLKTVVFGPKLRFIGSEVFYECQKLQDIYVGVDVADGTPQIPVCAPGAFFGVGYNLDVETAGDQKQVKHPGWSEQGFDNWGNIVYDLVKVHVSPYVLTLDGRYVSKAEDRNLTAEVIEIMRNTECSTDESLDNSQRGKGFSHQGWDRDWEKAYYCYRDHKSADNEVATYSNPCDGSNLGDSPYQVGNFWYVSGDATINDVINPDEMGEYGEQVLINIPIEEFIFNQNWQSYETDYEYTKREDQGMHIIIFFKAVRDDVPKDEFTGIFNADREEMANGTMNVVTPDTSTDIEITNVLNAHDVTFQRCQIASSGMSNQYTGVNNFIREHYGTDVADMYEAYWSEISNGSVYRDCRSETLCVPNDSNKPMYYTNAIAEFHTDMEVVSEAHYEKHSVDNDEEIYHISIYAPAEMREHMVSYLTSYRHNSPKQSSKKRSNDLTMNNGLWVQVPNIDTADDIHYVYKNIYIDPIGVYTGVNDVITNEEETIDMPAKYYDLHGIQIEKPEKGNLYIQVKGNKTEKVLIK